MAALPLNDGSRWGITTRLVGALATQITIVDLSDASRWELCVLATSVLLEENDTKAREPTAHELYDVLFRAMVLMPQMK